MPISDNPTGGGIPAPRLPDGLLGRDHRRPYVWRPTVLDNARRNQIRERYAEAQENEPDLSRAAFAKRIATDYGVSAAAIRNVLYS